MKRKPAAFTPAARAVCSELLALLKFLHASDDQEKVKPLVAAVLVRLEKIFINSGKLYNYSDDQLLRALKAILGDGDAG